MAHTTLIRDQEHAYSSCQGQLIAVCVTAIYPELIEQNKRPGTTGRLGRRYQDNTGSPTTLTKSVNTEASRCDQSIDIFTQVGTHLPVSNGNGNLGDNYCLITLVSLSCFIDRVRRPQARIGGGEPGKVQICLRQRIDSNYWGC